MDVLVLGFGGITEMRDPANVDDHMGVAGPVLPSPWRRIGARRNPMIGALRYADYVASDAWRLSPARLAELLACGGRCRTCNLPEPDVVLEVHHRTYERLGCELPEDLVALCQDCHGCITGLLRRRALAGTALPAPRETMADRHVRILVDSMEDKR